MAFVIGDLVRVKVSWTRVDTGAAIDPSTITLRVKSPAGVVTVYTYALGEVIREALGVFYRDVATGTQAGWWYYRWEAGGVAVGADEGSFNVEASKVV